MANRYIDSELWSDSKFSDEFSPEDKYFWLMLLTTRYGNLAGCFEFSIKQMARDSGYKEEIIAKLVNRFINNYQMIDYDFDTKEILILNWYRYNWTKSPKFKTSLDKYVEKIKNKKFKEYVENLYEEYSMDTVSIQYRYDTISISNTISNTNSKDLSIKEVKEKVKKEKEEIKSYGEFGHVKLTDEQYQKAKGKYEYALDEIITDVDNYVEKTGVKYKGFLATFNTFYKNNKEKYDNINEQERLLTRNKPLTGDDMSDEDYMELLREMNKVQEKMKM